MNILNQKSRKTSLSIEDYKRALALGMIDGVATITKFGRVSVVDAEKIISEGGIYGLPVTAENVTTTSTDAVNDTNTGAGARELFLLGIDENDLLVWETKLIDALSVNKYKRVFVSIVVKAGTVSPTGVNGNYGTITVKQDTSLISMVQIPINQGRTQCACFTVPKGYTALIHYADTVSGSGKQSNNKIKTRCYNNVDEPFMNVGERDNFENMVGRKMEIPSEFKEMSDIVFTTISNASGADVSAVFVVELIENAKMGL